jgi:hypothetical protein
MSGPLPGNPFWTVWQQPATGEAAATLALAFEMRTATLIQYAKDLGWPEGLATEINRRLDLGGST